MITCAKTNGREIWTAFCQTSEELFIDDEWFDFCCESDCDLSQVDQTGWKLKVTFAVFDDEMLQLQILLQEISKVDRKATNIHLKLSQTWYRRVDKATVDVWDFESIERFQTPSYASNNFTSPI